VINHWKESNLSYRSLEKHWNLGKSTICRWINETDISHPSRKSKFNQISSFILEHMIEDSLITLNQLASKIFIEFKMTVSTSSLSRYLKKLRWSFKRVRKKTKTLKNTETVLNTFRDNIKAIGCGNILSLDEVGFQLDMIPHSGWSKKGERCIFSTDRRGRKNYSAIFIISTLNVISYQVFDHAITIDTFKAFLNNLNIVDVMNKTLVLDNLRIHHSKEVIETFKTLKIIPKWCPPYSPDLNPVEGVFSQLKARLNRGIIKTRDQLLTHIKTVVSDLSKHGFVKYYKNAFD